MSKISTRDLQGIVKAAQDVILLLADKHPDYGNHNNCNSAKMVEFWDFLNDKAAPPSVVKAMAEDLINCRKQSAILSHENEDLGNALVYWMKRAKEAEKANKGGAHGMTISVGPHDLGCHKHEVIKP